MAATISIALKVSGVLNGERVDFPTSGQYGPATITTSADILSFKEIDLPATTATVIFTVGTSSDIASALMFLITSTVACTITWRTSASDADNSAIKIPANVPMLLPGYQSCPYQTTSANRVDETVAAISSFSAYSPAGAGKVKIWALA
jgi:hypothetical protein